MQKLKLRAMTDTEYQAWVATSRVNYARDKEKEGLSPEDAKAEAERSFAKHLPQGRETPNHHIYAVALEKDDSKIGYLWWGLMPQGTKNVAWIFDIAIDEEKRGKGFGRATMQLALEDVKSKGYDRMGLHVFGYNRVAQELYKSLGFETTNIVMYKDL